MTHLADYAAAMSAVGDGEMKHCPMPLTVDGRGPADVADFHHWGCWCADGTHCTAIFDLAWAALNEVLAAHAGTPTIFPMSTCGKLAEDARGYTASCSFDRDHDGHCSWWTPITRQASTI